MKARAVLCEVRNELLHNVEEFRCLKNKRKLEIKSPCCSAKHFTVVTEQEQNIIRGCLLKYDMAVRAKRAKTFRIKLLLPSSE